MIMLLVLLIRVFEGVLNMEVGVEPMEGLKDWVNENHSGGDELERDTVKKKQRFVDGNF